MKVKSTNTSSICRSTSGSGDGDAIGYYIDY